MLVVSAIMVPLLIALSNQLEPGRAGRQGEEIITLAMAASDPSLRSPASDVHSASTVETDDSDRLISINSSAGLGRLADVESTMAAAQVAPIRPVVWYQVAATDHSLSPYLLEALHQVETSAAPDGCWQNVEGSGATGPFQFKQATFEAYGLDANNDGLVDICGFADSLGSAARYLRVLGADGSVDSAATRRALERYGTDSDRVIDLARYYASREAIPVIATR